MELHGKFMELHVCYAAVYTVQVENFFSFSFFFYIYIIIII